ncbi:MAG: M20/M25/M40 family metallo-hydrolase, partial [Thermoclostridium sp.]|nr:M20/M25/M40 family metallo-hydrolase [Thermoclostridium sp.]
KPERTICFAFTHDEEIGGIKGTASVAEMFEARGMRFQYVLDEGGMITAGIIPGITEPVAMIATAEKGAVNIELQVNQTGGTSAVPPEQTSIEILCEAINKIEKNQFTMRIDGATKQMFEYIGPEMGFLNKLFFSNLWIFDGAVKNQLSKSSSLTATLKTTTAVTIINGGIKANILPTKATAVINVRIIQGDSIESVVKHIEQTINDKRVSIKLIGYSCEPSPVSDTETDGFQDINKTIKQVFPEVIVTPYLWTGGTNSKHFVKYADNIYRFSPVFIDKASKNCIHGADEKISIDNLQKCKTFYKQLILNSAK